MIVLDKHGNNFPNEVNLISSLDGIKADFYFYRVYEVSEDSRYSDYYPVEKMIRLPRDTEEVYLNLHIWNPNKVKLKVIKAVWVNGKLATSRIVYHGRTLDKVFQFKGPLIQGAEVKIGALVYFNNDQLLLVAGYGLYKFPREEVVPERGN